MARCTTHMFDMRRRDSRIEHQPTKIKHPWTNGQPVKRYLYDLHEQLEARLSDFIIAYNCGRRLRTLAPYEHIYKL